jgi:histidinol-phosphate/aromatic aminotransferase/cobyric acid decarboxylase-like protein
MGGFRLGFALGNAQALASLEAVKVSKAEFVLKAS